MYSDLRRKVALYSYTVMVNLNVFSQISPLIERELFKDLVAKHTSDKHCTGINKQRRLFSYSL
ncbi:hypothetical protein QE382_003198 [Sphingobacterium zeae]|uniref:DUF4372 domain-containing protein n=1 Tax=Sphingobacterium zeae TaxID=1776859 RepID=A0ABU0U8C9_9SPHI|nr:hypothetical protein [Sphingobacterium zeae]